jgi:hypothetical protein
MQPLTPEGQNLVNDLSYRYNLSSDAILHMIGAVNQGGGTMAQFNSPELGGGGQWMQGGMTMVGDMFNYGLKNTVNNLCTEISNALSTTQIFPIIPAGTPGSNQWWGMDLGIPFSSGGQNNIRYALFPHRLAVEMYGTVTIYDTLDHHIGGVSQQQGGDTSLTFSSQYGTLLVTTLPIVSGNATPPPPQTNFAQPTMHQTPIFNLPIPEVMETTIPLTTYGSSDEVIQLLEKLAKLRDSGILNEAEFDTKKGELLSRL